MTYATLMVHLETRQSNAAVLQVASDLARRMEAKVIGIASCRPMPIVYSDGYVPSDLFDLDRNVIAKDIADVKLEFVEALTSQVHSIEWRSQAVSPSLAGYVAREARSADLVITGALSDDLFDASWRMDTGDLIMRAGRPVIVVPASASAGPPKSDRVLLAWKDTRETRRAAADALPLLKMASHVKVVEIARADEVTAARMRLQDVVDWLARHDVIAELLVVASISDDTSALLAVVKEHQIDIVVAGAYGHSRLREWALGSVTRDLLHSTRVCTLFSH